MAEIFITYRRDDALGHATSIYEHLIGQFGAPAVFIDIGSIMAGSRWLEQTKAQVDSCEVCIPVIGQRWRPERLRDKDDPVRLELETALNGNKAMIPVLVDGANLPAISDLPPSLKDLPSWQAIWLDHRSYETYQHGLMTLVERIGTLLDRRGFVRPQPYGVVQLRIAHEGTMFDALLLHKTLGWAILANGKDVGSVRAGEETSLRLPAGFYQIALKRRVSIWDTLAFGRSTGMTPVVTFVLPEGATKRLVFDRGAQAFFGGGYEVDPSKRRYPWRWE
jgi:TIR domain